MMLQTYVIMILVYGMVSKWAVHFKSKLVLMWLQNEMVPFI